MLDVPTFNDVSKLRQEIERLKKLLITKDKTIHRLRKECGIKQRVSKRDVIAMIEAGFTDAQVREILGVHRSTIFRAKEIIKKAAVG